MKVATLKEELDYAESCRQKQEEEYSTNLEDLKKRVHDLQLGRTKDVEAAHQKIDMMEKRLSTLIYVYSEFSSIHTTFIFLSGTVFVSY